jgi:hypothetical protein
MIVSVYSKGDRGVQCYQLPAFLLSRFTPYVREIIGDHQCGFRHNRSTSDQIFCIPQILEKKKWE